MVLRLDIHAQYSISELLHYTQKIVLDALAHQHAPFEQVIQEVVKDRELERNPIFDVMFTWFDEPLEMIGVSGLTLTPQYGSSGGDFPLTFEMMPIAHSLTGSIKYNKNLFSKTLIQQFATHYVQLLDDMLRSMEKSVSELQMLYRGMKNIIY